MSTEIFKIPLFCKLNCYRRTSPKCFIGYLLAMYCTVSNYNLMVKKRRLEIATPCIVCSSTTGLIYFMSQMHSQLIMQGKLTTQTDFKLQTIIEQNRGSQYLVRQLTPTNRNTETPYSPSQKRTQAFMETSGLIRASRILRNDKGKSYFSLHGAQKV